MLQGRLLTLLIALAFSSIPTAYAQLGPKEAAKPPPTDLQRVKVGEPAPDFTLENMDGKRISLSDLRGKKNVVLVFYRGHW